MNVYRRPEVDGKPTRVSLLEPRDERLRVTLSAARANDLQPGAEEAGGKQRWSLGSFIAPNHVPFAGSFRSRRDLGQ
jgi:hypothetical protein